MSFIPVMADRILQKSFQNADLVIKKHSTNTENSFAAQIFFVETTFFQDSVSIPYFHWQIQPIHFPTPTKPRLLFVFPKPASS